MAELFKQILIVILLLVPWGIMSDFLLQLEVSTEAFSEPLSWMATYQVLFAGVVLGAFALVVAGYKTRDANKITDAALDAAMSMSVSLALTPFALIVASNVFKGFLEPNLFFTWQATLGAGFIFMLIGMRIRSVFNWFVAKYSGNKGGDGNAVE